MDKKEMNVVVLGATGATGRYILGELCMRDDIKTVTTIGRRPATIPEEYGLNQQDLETTGKLKQIVAQNDFGANTVPSNISPDMVFCAIGTTRKDAGSAQNFEAIDRDLVLALAKKFSTMNSVKHFSYCSSMNANKNSWFLYPRVKGEVEEGLKALNFPTLAIHQPGFLNRGDKARWVETLAAPLRFVMPSIECRDVAKAMVSAGLSALNTTEGTTEATHTYSNCDMNKMAKKYVSTQ